MVRRNTVIDEVIFPKRAGCHTKYSQKGQESEFHISLFLNEVPFTVVGLEVIFCKGRCAVCYASKNIVRQ